MSSLTGIGGKHEFIRVRARAGDGEEEGEEVVESSNISGVEILEKRGEKRLVLVVASSVVVWL